MEIPQTRRHPTRDIDTFIDNNIDYLNETRKNKVHWEDWQFGVGSSAYQDWVVQEANDMMLDLYSIFISDDRSELRELNEWAWIDWQSFKI